MIGKLYMAIDPNLQKRIVDNAYWFIEKIITIGSTCLPSTTLMTHNTHDTHKRELKSLQLKVHVDEQANQMHKLSSDLNSMKQELEKTKQELNSTRQALTDITNESAVSKEQYHHSTQQVLKWK